MSFRNIAASLLIALGVATLTTAPAVAQTASAPAATAASDAAAPAAAPVAPAPLTASTTKETIDNPYGLEALWKQGDFVSKGTLIILFIMSMASWYVMVTKLYEQHKIMREAKDATGKFWEAPSVQEAWAS